MGEDFKAQNELCSRAWELVAGQIHTPLEDGTHVDSVPACPEPRVQHSPERQHQLVVECGHDRQSSSMGSEDTASHLQASHEAGRTRLGYRKRTAQSFRKSWRKIGLPLLTEKIGSKISTSMTWAVYVGDVSTMRALRSILWWRTTAWWKSRASWVWHGTRLTSHVGSITFGLRNRRIQWDTPILDKANGATTAPQGRRYSQFT